MKNLLILSVALLAFVSCGNHSKNKATDNANIETAVQVADESTIYVYYFHRKQRCKTCIAVETVAKETIENTYADNKEVCFIEINTEDKANEKLVVKYQVTWNALIVAKENNSIEITKQAFANAVNSPEVLAELIKTEVNKRLVE